MRWSILSSLTRRTIVFLPDAFPRAIILRAAGHRREERECRRVNRGERLQRALPHGAILTAACLPGNSKPGQIGMTHYDSTRGHFHGCDVAAGVRKFTQQGNYQRCKCRFRADTMVLAQIRTPARTWPDAEKINIAMLCTLSL
jgi:hypothetical protein